MSDSEDDALAEEMALADALADRRARAGGDDGDDDDGDDDGSAPDASVGRLYDKAGLELACKTLDRSADLAWVETLDLAAAEPVEVESAHDDLQREVAFYTLALDAVKEGREKLTELGVPFKRPDDYFCEMIKSDGHMARVKDRLIFEQKKMAAFEQRKEQQERKKFSRAVQARVVFRRCRELFLMFSRFLARRSSNVRR